MRVPKARLHETRHSLHDRAGTLASALILATVVSERGGLLNWKIESQMVTGGNSNFAQ